MNKKTPKLSIITVCYNNKNGLQKTMESVACQTFTDYEYIIIDGGSTDGTVELIKNEECKMKNLRWVSEKDNGIYDAMNKGIKMANGEYCYFLNSDDYIAAPNTLEKIFKKVNSDCHCGESRNRLNIKRLRVKPTMTDSPDIIYGNLAILKNDRLHSILKYSSRITLYSFYCREHRAIHHQASFIKRDLFEKYGNYDVDVPISADSLFYYNAVMKHKVKTQYINRVFAIFTAGGASYSCSPKEREEVIHRWDKMLETTNPQNTHLKMLKKRKIKSSKFYIFNYKIAKKLYLILWMIKTKLS